MTQSKIFLLIIILVAIIAAAFLINYSKQPSPEIQPIKLPVKEKISVPEEKKEAEEVKMVEIKKIKDEIRTKAEGEIIKYQEESFYSENDFSVILENEKEFKSQLVEILKESLIGVEVENFEVNLDQSKKSALLKCDIKGAKYGSNSYDMHFLIGPLGLDLWDDFKPHQPPYGRKLTFEGEINRVPTKLYSNFLTSFPIATSMSGQDKITWLK